MNRVFVLKAPSADISSAESFGEITYITENVKINQYNGKIVGEFLTSYFEEVGFNPEEDFVLLVGTNILVAQMFMSLLVEYDAFTALIFNPVTQTYTPQKYFYEHYLAPERTEEYG